MLFEMALVTGDDQQHSYFTWDFTKHEYILHQFWQVGIMTSKNITT